MSDEQFQEWLRGLGDGPQITAAIKTLPTDRQEQTALLMACQLLLWQMEAEGQDTTADLAVLAQLRDRLLG